MTVQSSTSRADYDGNGVTVEFTVPFRFLRKEDLLVLRTDVNTNTVTTLVLDSIGANGYTVSGAGTPNGGSIQVVTAPTGAPSLQKLSILRSVPFTQLTDYLANDPFPAESHERALDKVTMIVQQLSEELSRALRLSPGVSGVDTEIPIIQALKPLVGSADGTSIEFGSTELTGDMLLRPELQAGSLDIWTNGQRWGQATSNFILNSAWNNYALPFSYIRRENVVAATTQYAAATYTYVKRTGGNPWAGNSETYWVTADMTSGFDLGRAISSAANRINGGTLCGLWLLTQSPSAASPDGLFTGKVYCAEFNYGNRWQEFGLSRNINTGSWVAGLLMVPDVVLGPDGYDSTDGHFNASFGIVFGPAKSGAAQRRTWTLIHADDDSVPAGGLHMCMRGGSTAGNAPLALLEARDNWNNLIDLSPATIVGTAIKLRDVHTIMFGDRDISYGDAIPGSGQWLRGSIRFNNLAMSAADIAPAWMNVGSGTPGNWAQFGEIIYNGSKTFDPPSIAAAGTTTTTVTVTGAALGDFADASFSLSLGGLVVTAYVSAANTVTVVFFNPTGGAVDLGSGTLRARCRKA